MPILLQPAWVLHTKAYRESSLLVYLLTEDYGRITLIAKGARRQSKKASLRALLQPFHPLIVSWTGRTSLSTLTHAEAQPPVQAELKGRCLACGFYVNELLMYLVHAHDPCSLIYQQYTQLMRQLAKPDKTYHNHLRYFEKHLLSQIGFGLDLQYETGPFKRAIVPERYYTFNPKQGLTACVDTTHNTVYSGRMLHALAEEILSEKQDQRAAKALLSTALRHHLGTNVIRSATLLIDPSVSH